MDIQTHSLVIKQELILQVLVGGILVWFFFAGGDETGEIGYKCGTYSGMKQQRQKMHLMK